MGIYYVGNNGQPNKITISQALQYAQQAGFSGSALYTSVAIAIAESGLAVNSTNTTTSGVGLDRGVVKFNSVFHKEVPDSCAYDPACAFREFYRVSQGGKNFCEWCTYNLNCANPCNSNGPYKNNIPMVQAAATGLPSSIPSVSIPTGSTPGLFGGTLDTLKSWGEYAAVFILALFFILAGFYLMNQEKINHAISQAGDVAIKAALV